MAQCPSGDQNVARHLVDAHPERAPQRGRMDPVHDARLLATDLEPAVDPGAGNSRAVRGEEQWPGVRPAAYACSRLRTSVDTNTVSSPPPLERSEPQLPGIEIDVADVEPEARSGARLQRAGAR